ncbi:MAG: hypothetical protein ACE5GZ_12710 [Gammaproteobacteria bacterium]
MIEDDARVLRFICKVAERLGLSCFTTSNDGDIETACKQSAADVILLDPRPHTTLGEKVLRQLAGQQTIKAVVLASTDPDEIGQLEELGSALGLNMVGALPDVFDADTLKQKLGSIFKQAGAVPACHPSADRNGSFDDINDSKTS